MSISLIHATHSGVHNPFLIQPSSWIKYTWAGINASNNPMPNIALQYRIFGKSIPPANVISRIPLAILITSEKANMAEVKADRILD